MTNTQWLNIRKLVNNRNKYQSLQDYSRKELIFSEFTNIFNKNLILMGGGGGVDQLI